MPATELTNAGAGAGLRYGPAYLALAAVSLLDILFTFIILSRGGRELNPLADGVIAAGGLHGTVAFKFGLMLMLVGLCEVMGRIRPRVGPWIAGMAVILWGLPPLWAYVQIGK